LAGAPAPGANGCGGSHRGGAPTADPDILVSSVPSRSPRPGCEWGWRFSHRGGAPTAGPDILVRPVPSRSTRPGCEWGWRFSHRGGAPTAGPDIRVSSVLAGAPAPGANKLGTTPAGALLRRGLRDTAAPRQSPSHGTPAGSPTRPCAR